MGKGSSFSLGKLLVIFVGILVFFSGVGGLGSVYGGWDDKLYPPTPTATPICEHAAFADQNVQQIVAVPGQQFSVIWTVTNIGNCSWPVGTKLAFVDGEEMGVSSVASEPVNPGASFSFELVLTAPAQNSVGYWKISLGDGKAVLPNRDLLKVSVQVQ